MRWQSAPARNGIRGRRGGVRGSTEGEPSPGCGRFGVCVGCDGTQTCAGTGCRPDGRAGCLEGGGARSAGRFPAPRGRLFRVRPGRARHGMRRVRAPLQRLRGVVGGCRDCGTGGSGLAVTRTPAASPAPSGPSRGGCSVQTSRGRPGRRIRAPGPLWAWPPRCTRTSRAHRGDHLWRGGQFVSTARYSPASLSP